MEVVMDIGLCLLAVVLIWPGVMLYLDWMLESQEPKPVMAFSPITEQLGGYPPNTYNEPQSVKSQPYRSTI